jgi:hypothetical protein
VIAWATAARAAESPGPIIPSVARACLRAHDHTVPPRAPRRIATLAGRSTVPAPHRDPDASGDRGVQTL